MKLLVISSRLLIYWSYFSNIFTSDENIYALILVVAWKSANTSPDISNSIWNMISFLFEIRLLKSNARDVKIWSVNKKCTIWYVFNIQFHKLCYLDYQTEYQLDCYICSYRHFCYSICQLDELLLSWKPNISINQKYMEHHI